MPIDYANLVFQVSKNQAKSDIDSIGRSLKNAGDAATTLQAALTKIGIGLSLGALVSQTVKWSGELARVQRAFSSIFAGSQQAVQGMRRLTAEFQMTGMQAENTLSQIGQRLRNLVPREALGQISTDLAVLTQNIASQFGESEERIKESLIRGLQGQTRGLKDLGIFIDVNSEELKAAADALKEMHGYTENQAKSLAIMQEIQKQAQDSAGAFAKNADTIKTQVGNIKNTIEEIIASIVSKLDPIISPILKLVNSTLAKVFGNKFVQYTVIAAGIGVAIKTVFGYVQKIYELTASKLTVNKEEVEAYETMNKICKAMAETSKSLHDCDLKILTSKQKILDLQKQIAYWTAKGETGIAHSFVEEAKVHEKFIEDMRRLSNDAKKDTLKVVMSSFKYKSRDEMEKIYQMSSSVLNNFSLMSQAALSIKGAFTALLRGDWASMVNSMTHLSYVMKVLMPKTSNMLSTIATKIAAMVKTLFSGIASFFTSAATFGTLGVALLGDVIISGFTKGWRTNELYIINFLSDAFFKLFFGAKKIIEKSDTLDKGNAMASTLRSVSKSLRDLGNTVIEIKDKGTANALNESIKNLTDSRERLTHAQETLREYTELIKKWEGFDTGEVDFQGTKYTLEDFKNLGTQLSNDVKSALSETNSNFDAIKTSIREAYKKLEGYRTSLEEWKYKYKTRSEKLSWIEKELRKAQAGPQTEETITRQISLYEKRLEIEKEAITRAEDFNKALSEIMKSALNEVSSLRPDYVKKIAFDSMEAYEAINRRTTAQVDLTNLMKENVIQEKDLKTVKAIEDLKTALIKEIQGSVRNIISAAQRSGALTETNTLEIVGAF